jgi:DHA1 family inner membrane transport protein
VSGLPLRAVAPVLLITGLADAAGVVITGLLLDRHPVVARVGPVAVLCAALFALFALGSSAVATILLEACAGIGLSGVAIALQSHVLEVAPRRTDIASAWYSASFNVGIAGGPLVGGVVLSTLGVRFNPLVGGTLVLLGLVAVIVEARPAAPSVAAR